MTHELSEVSRGSRGNDFHESPPRKIGEQQRVLPFQAFLEQHRAAIANDWQPAAYSAIADCCLQHEESVAHANRWKRFALMAEHPEQLGGTEP